MAIESHTSYYIRCDRCRGSAGGRVYENDKHRVAINAIARGWITQDGKHLCPNCIYTDYLHLKYESNTKT